MYFKIVLMRASLPTPFLVMPCQSTLCVCVWGGGGGGVAVYACHCRSIFISPL